MSRSDRLDCKVEIVIRDKSPLPTFLIVAYMQNGEDHTAFPLEPKSHSEDSYIFQARLKAPPKVGKYQLRVDAASKASNPPGGVAKVGADGMYHVYGLGPSVEVRP